MMFEQLKKLTSSLSLDEVISSYVSQEEEMFSLYNFIQTVNTEIDTVLESSANIEAAIKAYNEEQQVQQHTLTLLTHALSAHLLSYSLLYY